MIARLESELGTYVDGVFFSIEDKHFKSLWISHYQMNANEKYSGPNSFMLYYADNNILTWGSLLVSIH